MAETEAEVGRRPSKVELGRLSFHVLVPLA